MSGKFSDVSTGGEGASEIILNEKWSRRIVRVFCKWKDNYDDKTRNRDDQNSAVIIHAS